jgi:hypothetical protein
MKDFSLHLLKVQYRIFQIITGAGDRENKRFAEFLSDSRNYKWTTAAFCLVSNNN